MDLYREWAAARAVEVHVGGNHAYEVYTFL
jgi:hypothetical protein